MEYTYIPAGISILFPCVCLCACPPWTLQFLVRVVTFLSLILCYSCFGTFLSTWSNKDKSSKIKLKLHYKVYFLRNIFSVSVLPILGLLVLILWVVWWWSNCRDKMTHKFSIVYAEDVQNIAIENFSLFITYFMAQHPLESFDHPLMRNSLSNSILVTLIFY